MTSTIYIVRFLKNYKFRDATIERILNIKLLIYSTQNFQKNSETK